MTTATHAARYLRDAREIAANAKHVASAEGALHLVAQLVTQPCAAIGLAKRKLHEQSDLGLTVLQQFDAAIASLEGQK